MSVRRGLGPSAVLFTCLFAAQAALLVLSPILTQVANEFGVTTAQAAQLRSVSGVTAGLAAIALATRGGRLAGLLRSGLLLLVAGSVASALSPTFLVLLAAQIVIGLGLALVLSGGLAASEAWAAEGESSKVLSWALIGQPVAWIIGQPVVGLVAGVDWRWAWIAVPAASGVAALVALGLRRRISEERFECDPVGLLRTPGVPRWVLGELAAFAAWAGTLVYAGALFIESYGVDVGLTGMILGVVAAAYLPGNFLGRRWLKSGSQAPLLGFALAAAATVAVLGWARLGVVFSTVVLSVLAMFAGGRTISGAALGLQLAGGQRLAGMSVRTAVLQFGYLLGSAIGGLVLPEWGFPGMLTAFAVLFFVAALIHGREIVASGAGGLRAAARHLRRA